MFFIDDNNLQEHVFINRDSKHEFKVRTINTLKQRITLESFTGPKCTVTLNLIRFKQQIITKDTPWQIKSLLDNPL